MGQVLLGCEEWAAAYLDDLLICGSSWEKHLTKTLKRIQDAGLTLNVKKCEWARQEISNLGYHLGNGNLRPQVDKVEAIRWSPRPSLKKEMRSFLSLVALYRRIIPNFTTITIPLSELSKRRCASARSYKALTSSRDSWSR